MNNGHCIRTPDSWANRSETRARRSAWRRIDPEGVLRYWAILSCLAFALVVVTGCQTSDVPAVPPGAALDGAGLDKSTQLLEGDVIQIAFEGASNLNTTVRVPLDGKITMPFIGQVEVLGKTPQELKEALAKLYEVHLRTTEIRVTLVAPVAAVYVSGAVLKPVRVTLDRPLTVLDAVMEAGGPDPVRAKLTHVTVLRLENGKRVAHRVNLKKELMEGNPNVFYLKPFDAIYVPERIFNF